MLPRGPIAHTRHVAQIPQVPGFTLSVLLGMLDMHSGPGRGRQAGGSSRLFSDFLACLHLFPLFPHHHFPGASLLAVLPVQGDLEDLPPRAWERVSSLHCVY